MSWDQYLKMSAFFDLKSEREEKELKKSQNKK